MRRLLRLTIVLVSSAVTGAVLTGSAWFLIAYANHPAALDDRGFFTVGPGFVGLLGANIGLVQGGLLGTLVASFSFTPTAGAFLGAALGGAMLLLLGMPSWSSRDGHGTAARHRQRHACWVEQCAPLAPPSTQLTPARRISRYGVGGVGAAQLRRSGEIHMSGITLPSVPHMLEWEGVPHDWQINHDQTLQITAGPKTDLFIDPQGTDVQHSAPCLLFAPDPQFTLSARIAVPFASTFDAGVLCIYANPTCWAKLCFEFSPQHQPMIVSVVTNTVSDDCNSAVVSETETYLRITRLGPAYAFHYSLDGNRWQLVRYFRLSQLHDIRIGFEAQSPTGEGCTATFSDIQYRPQAIQDIRSGD